MRTSQSLADTDSLVLHQSAYAFGTFSICREEWLKKFPAALFTVQALTQGVDLKIITFETTGANKLTEYCVNLREGMNGLVDAISNARRNVLAEMFKDRSDACTCNSALAMTNAVEMDARDVLLEPATQAVFYTSMLAGIKANNRLGMGSYVHKDFLWLIERSLPKANPALARLIDEVRNCYLGR